jgi:hypothetical protein
MIAARCSICLEAIAQEPYAIVVRPAGIGQSASADRLKIHR